MQHDHDNAVYLSRLHYHDHRGESTILIQVLLIRDDHEMQTTTDCGCEFPQTLKLLVVQSVPFHPGGLVVWLIRQCRPLLAIELTKHALCKDKIKVMGSRSKVTEIKVICHKGQRGQTTGMKRDTLNYCYWKTTHQTWSQVHGLQTRTYTVFRSPIKHGNQLLI